MKTWNAVANLQQHLLTRLTAPLAEADECTPDFPPNVIDWLAQLSLLYGVPFEYLVPDARMLPQESMRFFYVDRNWLDRAVDGALSLGTFSSAQNVFNEKFYEAVYREVDARVNQMRAQLRKRAAPAEAVAGGELAGILFRSVIVSTWPGIEVKGYAGETLLPILRMDRLSPDVLLVIFNGVPASVEMIEPAEGLSMGIQYVRSSEPGEIVLRGLGFASLPAGEPIRQGPGYLKAPVEFRSGAGQPAGVVNVDALKAEIEKKLPAGSLGPPGELTPAGMAIQLVLAAGKQEFLMNAPDCESIVREAAEQAHG